jgi:Do/DeqQ family serine protease
LLTQLARILLPEDQNHREIREEPAMANKPRLESIALSLVFVSAWINSGVAGSQEPKLTFAPLLSEVTPAVVNVSAASPFARDAEPLPDDPTGRRFMDVPEGLQPRQSIGSGVIVDADEGLIMTNHHVVQNAASIVVTLTDRRQFNATLIGSDAGTDVALLHVDADRLTAIPFGDSDQLRVGDFVIAIGNPFGLGQTATSGIVSALGRSGISLEGYEDFIQTDASINPGSSGGPLIDVDGNLMGVNTAILSPGGGNIGIGFAIPSNMAQEVITQLLQHGEVRRGRLGIMMQDVTPGLSDALQLETTEGALITEVEPNSPAERVGILAGDVIIGVNGSPVQSSTDLRNEIGLIRLGESVSLEVVREGMRHTVRTEVADVAPDDVNVGATHEALAGAEFADIGSAAPELRGTVGVLVTEVQQGSPAWQHGLLANDIVVAVNRIPVGSVAELATAIGDAGSTVALQILRGGRQLFVLVR